MSAITFDIFAHDMASGAFDRVGGSAERAKEQMKGFAVAGAAALMAFAGESLKMAGDFQAAITRLETTAGESPKNLQLVSSGLLKMAGQVGFTAGELAKGMYTVESAGYHGAAGLAVMSAAAKGARIEGSDLTTVTDAVSSALVDYHLKGTDAAMVTNTLIAATGHGKTTFEGMASALPNVAAAGASAGISLAELASAIATMTMHGTDAAKAGTYLRQVIGQLEAPSAVARETMKGLGLNANTLALNLGKKGPNGGLAGTIAMVDDAITKHLQPSGLVAIETFKKSTGTTSDYQKMLANLPPSMTTTFGALSHMVGGVKSLQGFLQLGGENLKTFRANTAAVELQVKRGGKEIDGYAKYQQTFNAKVNDAKGAISAMMVQFGQKLMPVAIQFTDWITKDGVPGLESFGGWISKNTGWLVPLAVGVGTMIGLVKAWRLATMAFTLAQAAMNVVLDANPIGLVITLVAGLAAGLVYAYNHSKTFRDIVNGVWHDVAASAQWMWGVMKAVFRYVVDEWLSTAGWIIDGAAKMFGWVPGVGGKLKAAAHQFDIFRDDVNRSLAGVQPKTVTVGVDFNAQAAAPNVNGGMGGHRLALGGPITGGVPGKDSVHGLLMPGEFVVRADGSNLGDALAHYGARRYAAGGVVVSPHVPSGASITNTANVGWRSMLSHVNLSGLLASMGTGGSVGGGAARWLGTVLEVLAMLHQPSSLAAGVLRRINFESGGNPNAINLTDSNAMAGHPSQGLMQTIPSTFAAYAGPFRGLGIDNGLANIFAGLNYALHTYGNIANIDPKVRPYGYDRGGYLPPGLHTVYNGTGHMETIVPPGAGTVGGGGVHITINGALDPAGVARQIEMLLIDRKRKNGGRLELLRT